MFLPFLLGLLTDVGTTQYNGLGSLYCETVGYGTARDPAVSASITDRGNRVWIYVYNGSGVAFAQGDVLVRAAGVSTYNVRKSTQAAPQNASQVVGIANHAIASLSYGWVIRTGFAEVRADTGGLAADIGLQVGNAVDGTADQAAATASSFGYAIEAALATALATCWVDCRG